MDKIRLLVASKGLQEQLVVMYTLIELLRTIVPALFSFIGRLWDSMVDTIYSFLYPHSIMISMADVSYQPQSIFTILDRYICDQHGPKNRRMCLAACECQNYEEGNMFSELKRTAITINGRRYVISRVFKERDNDIRGKLQVDNYIVIRAKKQADIDDLVKHARKISRSYYRSISCLLRINYPLKSRDDRGELNRITFMSRSQTKNPTFEDFVYDENVVSSVKKAIQGNKNMLLYGPPGTGKSTISFIVQTIMKRNLFTITKDCIEYPLSFCDIEDEAVVLIDDIETIVDFSNNTHLKVVKDLLDRNMYTNDCIFIVTTNDYNSIPRVVKRAGRLDVHICVDCCSAAHIKALSAKHGFKLTDEILTMAGNATPIEILDRACT